ncbi:MAG: DUF882 domain-containing protein [Hyphomicrobiaceae bacterium]
MVLCSTAAAIGASTVGANRAAERTISLYNIHTKETVTVTYKRDGKFVPAAMERINWALRDWRKNEPTTMDPALIDLLWEMHTELGSRAPIHVISGYRSRGTNSMLKKTRGGQAENSQHINGKAADVHFPDVPIQRLRYSALVRERGGVGYYPLSALPFVHVDTARVRAWPRLPRQELALLFPSGRTQHMPADGGPLTPEDGRAARVRLASAGGEIGAFLNLRRGGGAPTVVADAGPPVSGPTPPRGAEMARAPAQSAWEHTAPQPTAPALTEPPRLVAAGPSTQDRAQLHNLARHASMMPEPRLLAPPRPAQRPPTIASLAADALGERQSQPQGHQVAALDAAGWTTPLASQPKPAGRFSWGETGQELRWVAATEFDEEHPDELSYRPFPVAPLLTDRADEPLLAELLLPDIGRALEMIDQPVARLPLHFRPTPHVAALMWSQQFTGSAVGLDRLLAPEARDGGAVRPRAVLTSAR